MSTAYWKDFWGARWRRTNPYGAPGPRSIYTKGYHRGEDIANGGNTADVPTLRAGEIIDSGRSGVIGHWLCVQPDVAPDERDIYCHMFEPSTIESGRVQAGDILGRTAGWGESPGSGWDGPHLHFVVSDRSDGGSNTSRADYDPNPRIDAALAADAPLAGNQRRSTGARARVAPTSQSDKVDDGYLDAGDVASFDVWTRGEAVDGNNVWLRGANHGRWYWSGGFEGGADTSGIVELASSLAPSQRRSTGARARVAPTSQSDKVDDGYLDAGDVASFDAWTRGEAVDGNDVWFRGATYGNWYWSGSFEGGANTNGLTEIKNAPTPQATPAPAPKPTPDYKNFTADTQLAKWVGSPNFNYREPRPAGQKPKHITLHWMTSTLEQTDAHFQNAAAGSASNYGVGPKEIHQYVREQDYQQADGNAESNRWGISVEHEMGPTIPIADSTIALSANLLADISKRNGLGELVWMKNVFPHSHFVATQCPGTLPYAEILKRANAILTPPKPDDDSVSVSRSWLQSILDKLKGILS